MHRDLVRLAPGVLDDLDGSVNYHEEGAIAFALGEQGVTRMHLTRLAPSGKGGDVGPAENRKGDVEIGHKKDSLKEKASGNLEVEWIKRSGVCAAASAPSATAATGPTGGPTIVTGRAAHSDRTTHR